jgi:hypothetical protein
LCSWAFVFESDIADGEKRITGRWEIVMRFL